MRVVPYQEIFEEKLNRQKAIKELEYHANGHCIHVGKISPGCRKCFTGEQGSGIQVGTQCMCKCPMCYYDPERREESQQSVNRKLADFFEQSMNPNWSPTIFSYQSTGETLMYLEQMVKFAAVLKSTSDRTGIKHYYFVYTNGILATEENLELMKQMGIHELRFHLSASNFSKKVLKNMELAGKMGFTLTLEEPSWPHHSEEIMELLPFLDSIGTKHIDMVETQITQFNKAALEKEYPGNTGRVFMDYYYHLYDEGLVYDIMEETIKRGYKFSVLDCNSGVERCRHGGDNHILFDAATINPACADFDYGI